MAFPTGTIFRCVFLISCSFPDERTVNLNAVYGTNGKRHKVRGLINILDGYKFTIAENTPIEEEIALDPELLGKVFENLLAAYNPETKKSARKQTGSYYTPREIVNYMTDESLVAYLKNELIVHSKPENALTPTTTSFAIGFQRSGRSRTKGIWYGKNVAIR